MVNKAGMGQRQQESNGMLKITGLGLIIAVIVGTVQVAQKFTKCDH